jgi:NAD(P)-dependent dehydrogenase (short-subunit alcohol dehydrogenase family)
MEEKSMTKTVGLVTGAGSGMGLACATRMADMVDVLFLADLNDGAVTDAAQQLSDGDGRATVDVFAVDITDESALAELSSSLSEAGTLRAVVHAAGISPTMADWRKIFQVDLIGTAMLTEMLFPLSVAGTSIVCYASMAPLLSQGPIDGAIDAVLDDPLQVPFLDRIHTAVGSSVEDSGRAYFWAKRGVHRLAQREAIRFGRRGARVCSVSPGIIDTPMGRQESAARTTNDMLVGVTPLARQGHPEEVAAVTTFLLSDEASYVNGIDVLVDGGTVAAVSRGAFEMTEG